MPKPRPLSPLMVRCLEVMADGGSMTGNDIGHAAGARRIRRQRGPWSGYQGPAQQVIPCLTALEARGLIRNAERRDGLSGTAYRITDAGRAALAEIARR